MCSRVRIQSRVTDSLKVTDTWRDSARTIKDINGQDALFTFKDGTARRLPIISGYRFLYFGKGKTEMGKFKVGRVYQPLESPVTHPSRESSVVLTKDCLDLHTRKWPHDTLRLMRRCARYGD